MPNITSVTVGFGNGIKRDEYGPIKKSEVSITAAVAEDEDGAAVLAEIGRIALAEVAALLDAPKPAVSAVPTVASESQAGEVPPQGEAPKRRGRPPKNPVEVSEKSEPEEKQPSEPPATSEPEPEASPTEEAPPAATEQDEWASAPEDIEITDQQILSATSKRAGELGAREPIVKLIATFATRTEGAPFKVQEIPQAQRKDYLDKLAALTA